MASNVSVSKGVFVVNKKKFVKKKKKSKSDDLMYSDPWYLAYKDTWKGVEEYLEELQCKTYSNVLNNVVSFVEKPFNENLPMDLYSVPTAALLTGINMPDHSALFSKLCNLLQNKVSPHVAILPAHKCKNIRQTIEQMTSQFMNSVASEDEDMDSSDDEKIVKVKKSQSNMLVLQKWYKEKYPRLSDVEDENSSQYLISKRTKCDEFPCFEEQEKEFLRSPEKLHQRKDGENEESKVSFLKSKREEKNSVVQPVRYSPRKSPRKSHLSSGDKMDMLVGKEIKLLDDDITDRNPSSNNVSIGIIGSSDDSEIFSKNTKKAQINRLDSKELQKLNATSPLKKKKFEERPNRLVEVTEEPRKRRTPKKVSRLIEEIDEGGNLASPKRLGNKNKHASENASISSSGRRSNSIKTPRRQNSTKKCSVNMNDTTDSEEDESLPSKRERTKICTFSGRVNAEHVGELKRTSRKCRMSISEREDCENNMKNTHDNSSNGKFSKVSKPSHETPRKSKRLKKDISYTEYDEENVNTQDQEQDAVNIIKDQCRTPQKHLQSMKHASNSRNSTPLKEKWVCELSELSPRGTTPLKIPKITLKQIDLVISKVNTNQSSPQKLKLKEIKTEEVNVSKCSPDKTPLTIMKNLELLKKNSDENKRKKLVVVIPEFEKFPSKVLQDFILILKSSLSALPIVLIMGIATSIAAVHQSLPYRMSACLCIKAFQSPPSVMLLNSILKEILFSSTCPFWLGSRTFSFLMDVFLCYDLSVKGFIQAFKYCMMEHFCGQNWKIICCRLESLKEKIGMLTAKDLSLLRNIPSFSRYLNNLDNDEESQKLMNNETFMKKRVHYLLKQLHATMDLFHLSLNCLNILVSDLPGKPLGSQVRELYGTGVSAPINRTSEYKECFKLIGFLSREELISKLDKILMLVKTKLNIPLLSWFSENLELYKNKVQEACLTVTVPETIDPKPIISKEKMTRYAFKEKLLEISKDTPTSPFEKARGELVEFLSSQGFPKLLKPPASLPLAEVLMFDDLYSIRSHIVGAPRAAIHTALTTPSAYLECECCVQKEKDSITNTMPDICIIYKLYRECGRMINLYDWLQAFSAVLDTKSKQDEDDEDDKTKKIDPEIHARFTRAVAELQFMGFLQISRRKVDHVTKLCFDGGM